MKKRTGEVIKIDPRTLVARASAFRNFAVVIEAGAPAEADSPGAGVAAMVVYRVRQIETASAARAIELIGAVAKKPLKRGRVRSS